jgi:hypothetical protein
MDSNSTKIYIRVRALSENELNQADENILEPDSQNSQKIRILDPVYQYTPSHSFVDKRVFQKEFSMDHGFWPNESGNQDAVYRKCGRPLLEDSMKVSNQYAFENNNTFFLGL